MMITYIWFKKWITQIISDHKASITYSSKVAITVVMFRMSRKIIVHTTSLWVKRSIHVKIILLIKWNMMRNGYPLINHKINFHVLMVLLSNFHKIIHKTQWWYLTIVEIINKTVEKLKGYYLRKRKKKICWTKH